MSILLKKYSIGRTKVINNNVKLYIPVIFFIENIQNITKNRII